MTATVNAVERTFRILDLFRDGQREYGVSEISRTLGLHKSTVHGILRTLSGLDILIKDDSTLKYRLGPGLIALGDLARQRLDLRELARPHLLALARRSGATVLLGTFEDEGITIVDVAEPVNALRVSASVGQRVPYCAGSTGRVFLAHLDAAEAERVVRVRGLPAFTASSVTDPDEYLARLPRVREQGFAVDDAEEYLDGVWAASAPVFESSGLAAVITVVGFTARVAAAELDEITAAIVQVARDLSRRLSGA